MKGGQMPKYNILIVDDEKNVISALKRALMNEDYNIFSAENANDGLKVLSSNPIHLIISDERMPGMSGSEFLSEAKSKYPNAIRIMLTGHASIESAMKVINEGEIYRFFTKPWNDVDLIFSIRAALEKYDLEAENRILMQTIKRQAIDMKLLEKQFPSITELKRDEKGSIIIEDITEDEMNEIILKCEREYPDE
jgi:two-component system, probable response regulator PhcQ